MITPENMTRTCGACPNPIADWNKIGYCRQCRNKYRKKPYNSEYEAGWRKKRQTAIAVQNAQQHAKAGGYPCTITIEDISPVPETCECCGVTMVRYGEWQVQPSLDKIIPARGYVPGNTAWICRRCNQVKNNSSLEELRTVVKYLEEHQ